MTLEHTSQTHLDTEDVGAKKPVNSNGKADEVDSLKGEEERSALRLGHLPTTVRMGPC